MITEKYPDKSGRKVWLNETEQHLPETHFDDDFEQKVAIGGMLDGLRGDECRHLRVGNIHDLHDSSDANREAHALEVGTSKKDGREIRHVPISNDLVRNMRALMDARGDTYDDELITRGKRTLIRWVEAAGEELAEETGDDRWKWLRPHDLRRTWATSTYYSIDAHYAESVVMRWGGWSNQDTFRDHDLGRPTETMTIDLMD